jgi:putative glutamine amidotransferase
VTGSGGRRRERQWLKRAEGAVPGNSTPNPVVIESGSAVAAILGPEADGFCQHRQASDRLGDGLRAVAYAADGTIEAVEEAGQAFAIGVQWHPEDKPVDDRLFLAFIAARYQESCGRGRMLGG